MSWYEYILRCPDCKKIAMFTNRTFSTEKSIVAGSLCDCNPQKEEAEMIEAFGDDAEAIREYFGIADPRWGCF